MLKKRKTSAWQYLSSSNYGTSGKVIVEIGWSFGSMSFLSPGGDTHEFAYQSAGVGAGFGFSVSFPKSDSIDSGSLYILESFRGEELSASDLAGFCLVAEASAGIFDFSGSGVAMVLGIPSAKLQNQLAVGAMQLGVNVAAGQFVGDKMQEIMKQVSWLKSDAKALLYTAGSFEGINLGFGVHGALGYLKHKSAKRSPHKIDVPIAPITPELPYKVAQNDVQAHIEIPGDVLFDFNKATIKPAAAKELHKAGALLRMHQGRRVDINGFTDSIGSDQFNDNLSTQRATAVMQWLVSNGYAGPAKVSIRGLGERFPVAPDRTPAGRDNPAGRARNRRVEIIVWKS
jgi:outer membrane protein OmpA-like peptidoglycan-associated protein